MANLQQAAVVINETWTEAGTNSRRFIAQEVTLTLTGQGGLTNLIPAALFGMTYIWEVRDARNSSNKFYKAAPLYDHSSIGLFPNSTLKQYVALGHNGAGNITVTGIATTDEITSVTDLTTPAQKLTSDFTIASANTVAQATATDLSAKQLLITTNSPARDVPGDVTDTIKLVVAGY